MTECLLVGFTLFIFNLIIILLHFHNAYVCLASIYKIGDGNDYVLIGR